MDFKTVIAIILKNFQAQQIDYAFIGGFALGVLGIMRSTMDIDLLVHKKDLPKIDQILRTHLYRLKYQSENVSQYVSDAKPFGTIDLLHAFRQRALAMLHRARKIPIFDGQYEIPVVIPEDLIGLKLQAMINNPERKTLELADIERLLGHFHHTMDWQLLREYFELFSLQEDFEGLKAKYGNT
jgi:predicted nucleotidyltransferase